MESSGRRRLRQDAGPGPASSDGVPEDPTHAHATVIDGGMLSVHSPVTSFNDEQSARSMAEDESVCIPAAAVGSAWQSAAAAVKRPSVVGHRSIAVYSKRL
jgi:hypothetical protein